MGRLFDDFFSGFGVPSLFTGAGTGAAAGAAALPVLTPRIDVSETDQEIRVAVELPGVDEANLDVTIDDDTLTIRGEQQAEVEDEDRDYRLRELVRGTFMRAIQLPFSPDPNQVRAVIRNGILNITIPKPAEVQQRQQRIQVQRDEGTGAQAAGGQATGAQARTRADRAAAGDKPSAAGQQSPSEQQAAAAGQQPSGGSAGKSG
ncbi:MAG TPA: Hsp20/alpha crystallin family protein [Stellaceae bacterium]